MLHAADRFYARAALFSQAHAYQHNKKDEVAIPPPEAGSSHGCKVHVAV